MCQLWSDRDGGGVVLPQVRPSPRRSVRQPARGRGWGILLVGPVLTAVALMMAIFSVRSRCSIEAPIAATPSTLTEAQLQIDPRAYASLIRQRLDDRLGELTPVLDRVDVMVDRVEQEGWHDRFEDANRIYERMAAALQRARDEDRWPVKLAGSDFNETQATAIIEQTRQYIERNRAPFTVYDQRVNRLQEARRLLTGEVQTLRKLRVTVDAIANDANASASTDIRPIQEADTRLQVSPRNVPASESVQPMIEAVRGQSLESLDLNRIFKKGWRGFLSK